MKVSKDLDKNLS